MTVRPTDDLPDESDADHYFNATTRQAARIRELEAAGDALANAARTYVHPSRRARALDAALDAWENR